MSEDRSRATDLEIESRVATVAGWLAASWSRREVLQEAAKLWGVSERQADEYRARAAQQLRADIATDREEIVAEQVAIRRRLIRLCVEDAEKAAAAKDCSPVQAAAVAGKLADGLAKLLGLYPTAGKTGDGRDPIEVLRDLLSVAAGQSQRPAEGGDAPPE